MALNEKDFEPIQDKEMASRYLRVSIENHQELKCYIKDTDFHFEGTGKNFNADKMEILVQLPTAKWSGETIRAEYNKTTERKIAVSFQTNSGLYLFSSTLGLAKMQEIDLLIKLPLYKLQRRQALRFPPNAEAPCTLFLPEPCDNSPVVPHDISTSGFSILVQKKMADFFSKGDFIELLQLSFLGQKYLVQAKVSNKVHLPYDKLDRWKIGLQFQRLDKNLEKDLAREAYRYNQRVWARRL